MWKKIWEKLKKPNGWILIVAYISTAVFAGVSLGTLFIKNPPLWVQILSYVSYALAALLLTYSVYTLVLFFPQIKAGIGRKIHSNRVTGALARNYDLRTVIFSAFSLVLTLAFSIYNGVVAIIDRSIWFGALAAYYLLLLFMRGGIVLYHGKKRGKEKEKEEEIRKYRKCGAFLIVVILALSAAILQMVVDDRAFVKPGLMIYVAATYTFLKLTLAIVNIVKSRTRTNSYTVSALHSVNLADASVSVLALQTSLLWEFSDGSMYAMNAVTGGFVSAFLLLLGSYMVIKGTRDLRAEKQKNFLRENHHGRTE